VLSGDGSQREMGAQATLDQLCGGVGNLWSFDDVNSDNSSDEDENDETCLDEDSAMYAADEKSPHSPFPSLKHWWCFMFMNANPRMVSVILAVSQH
jgi:hypothetical protein